MRADPDKGMDPQVGYVHHFRKSSNSSRQVLCHRMDARLGKVQRKQWSVDVYQVGSQWQFGVCRLDDVTGGSPQALHLEGG
jgi:hypothetical protein